MTGNIDVDVYLVKRICYRYMVCYALQVHHCPLPINLHILCFVVVFKHCSRYVKQHFNENLTVIDSSYSPGGPSD